MQVASGRANLYNKKSTVRKDAEIADINSDANRRTSMIQLTQGGAYLVNGTDIVADTPEAAREIQTKTGITISKEEAAKNTMAYGILREHNTSGNMDKLKIRFD